MKDLKKIWFQTASETLFNENEESGFYSYNAINPTVINLEYAEDGYMLDDADYVLESWTTYDYELFDYISFQGDVLTEDSVIINDYNNNINKEKEENTNNKKTSGNGFKPVEEGNTNNTQ